MDESGNSLLHEPVFPGDEKVGLYTLGAIEEVHQFRNKVAAVFTTHMLAKMEIISAFAANQGAGLLVFPEYSIPSAVLDACKRLSDGLNLTIVAGSQVVTRLSLRHFKEVGLPAGDDLQGRAVCPIFAPHQTPRLCQKNHAVQVGIFFDSGRVVPSFRAQLVGQENIPPSLHLP